MESIPGDPKPSDIFKPHRLNVELFEDMDEFFQQARENASGEKDDEETLAVGAFRKGNFEVSGLLKLLSE